MNKSAKRVLGFCVGGMLVASAAYAATTSELQGEPGKVLAACNAQAGNLSGASRDNFVRKCRIENTSPETKLKSCEYQMSDAISKTAQRDPVLRQKFLDDCVRNWNPKMK